MVYLLVHLSLSIPPTPAHLRRVVHLKTQKSLSTQAHPIRILLNQPILLLKVPLPLSLRVPLPLSLRVLLLAKLQVVYQMVLLTQAHLIPPRMVRLILDLQTGAYTVGHPIPGPRTLVVMVLHIQALQIVRAYIVAQRALLTPAAMVLHIQALLIVGLHTQVLLTLAPRVPSPLIVDPPTQVPLTLDPMALTTSLMVPHTLALPTLALPTPAPPILIPPIATPSTLVSHVSLKERTKT